MEFNSSDLTRGILDTHRPTAEVERLRHGIFHSFLVLNYDDCITSKNLDLSQLVCQDKCVKRWRMMGCHDGQPSVKPVETTISWL